MDQDNLRTLYTEHVVSYLQYRIGGQLTELITADILACEYSSDIQGENVFRQMLVDTINAKVGDYRVLPLVLERAELTGFEGKFLHLLEKKDAESSHSFDTIFDDLVAPHLADILGQELVTSVKKVFMKSVSAMPDQPLDVRFYMGMQAVYQFIPDVWSELEFAEQVKTLTRLLPKQDDQPEEDGEAGDALRFDELVERIIVSDLADILGRGHAMETVINTAQAKTEGIFYDVYDRFEQFVGHVLEDDFITRMFDSFWVDECQVKWLKEAKVLLK